MEETNIPLDPMAEENTAVEGTQATSAPADADAELDAEVAEGDKADNAETPAVAGEEVTLASDEADNETGA